MTKTLSTKEIARDLGLNIRSIQRYISEGFLPAIHTQGSNGQTGYFIDYSSYQDWKHKHFKSLKRGKISKLRRTDKEPGINEMKALAEEWIESLKIGSYNGKIYSQMTIRFYDYWIKQYWDRLDRYAAKPYISKENLLSILSQIPTDSFASRSKLYVVISSFTRFLISKEYSSEEELLRMQSIKPKRFLPAKKVTFSEEQIKKIIEANWQAKGNGYYDKLLTETVIVLFANTGLRASELCNLKLEDVDLEQKTLQVKHGKFNKNRRSGLNKRVLEALTKYFKARLQLADSEYFFLTRHGEKLKPNTLSHKWSKLSKKVGFTITNHGFRRSFVTINNRKGRSLVDLQIACGHADIKMTRSYCMTSEEEVVNAMQDWE